MRPYEVMIIFDPALEEAALQEQVDRSSALMSSRGATVGRVDRWGRRRLAYEIKHNREGYYVVMGTAAEPDTMTELNRSLQLADEVLRHKVVRLPDGVAARQGPSAPPEPAVQPPSGPPDRGVQGFSSSPRPDGASVSEATSEESAVPGPVAGNGDAIAADGAAEETTIDTNGA